MEISFIPLWLYIVAYTLKDTVLVAQVATVAITKSNSPTVKGQQHAVRCSFSQLQENVAFESLEMNYMLPNNTESGLAVMRSPGFSLFSGYSYFGFVSTDIGHENSVESNYMSLTLPSATCLIVGVRFWCVLSATTHSSLVSIISKEKSDRITLDLVARPIVLSIVASKQSVEEGGSVTITCTANVGRPTGHVRWMKMVGTAKEDISDQPEVTLAPAEGDRNSCTTVVTSRLSIELLRTPQYAPVEVWCEAVNSQTQDTDYAGCPELPESLCQSSLITVEYPAAVSITDGDQSVPEGADVVFTCTVSGNPVPSVMWMKDGSDSQWSGLFLRLTAVSVASNGSYTCFATNTVQSVQHTANASVLLIVVETTAAPSTTPSSVDTSPASEPSVGGVAGSSGDGVNSVIIIVVVLAALTVAVMAAVGVVFFCKHNSKKVEFSGDAVTGYINTAASRPDVVNDEYATVERSDSTAVYAQVVHNKPRSRHPLVVDESDVDCAHISIPQV